jgi:hypothetical protein
VHVSFLFIAYESSYTHKYIHLSHIYLSAFRDRGVPGPTSKLSSRAPAQMGRRETWKSRGLRVCPAPRSGALAVGGYKRPRGRERVASRERQSRPLPRAANLL